MIKLIMITIISVCIYGCTGNLKVNKQVYQSTKIVDGIIYVD